MRVGELLGQPRDPVGAAPPGPALGDPREPQRDRQVALHDVLHAGSAHLDDDLAPAVQAGGVA
jgi:hypothetical protein